MASAAPVCAGCGKAIVPTTRLETNYAVSALDTTWHAQCFKCATCGTPLAGEEYFEAKGAPACGACAKKAAAAAAPPAHPGVQCKACKKPISGQFTKAYGFAFHNECMVCGECKKPIANDGFFDDDTNKPVHLACLK